MAIKRFHISDVLSITTERLVSTRHMEGVYDILNYMTGDDLYTHQLPRSADECKPVLCRLFPSLAPRALAPQLATLERLVSEGGDREAMQEKIEGWLAELVKDVAASLPLDDRGYLPVPRLMDHQHTHIDPVEEARAMVGDEKVIVVEAENGSGS